MELITGHYLIHFQFDYLFNIVSLYIKIFAMGGVLDIIPD